MTEVTEAYLNLPSSTRDIFAANTVANFTVHLTTPIELMPGYLYEIALIKIIYPPNAYNVEFGEIYYMNMLSGEPVRGKIRSGLYSLPRELELEFLNVMKESHNQSFYILEHEEERKRFKMRLRNRGDEDEVPWMVFSENLQALTGLPAQMQGENIEITGENTWDETGGFQNIYIYTNIADNVNVGDMIAPLVCVIPFEGGPNAVKHISYEPRTPIYVPVRSRRIESVRVELKTKTGSAYPFSGGEAFVMLHLRRKAI